MNPLTNSQLPRTTEKTRVWVFYSRELQILEVHTIRKPAQNTIFHPDRRAADREWIWARIEMGCTRHQLATN
jgi:hypothetical protein